MSTWSQSVSLGLKGAFSSKRRERLLGPECLAFALTTFSNVHDTSLKLPIPHVHQASSIKQQSSRTGSLKVAVTPGRPLDWSHARCVGVAAGDFLVSQKSGRPSESPSRGVRAGVLVLEMPLVPGCHWLGTTSTAGAGAVELQLVAHLSCDLTGRRLVEKPPGLHLGPDCRSGFRRSLLTLSCLLAAAAAAAAAPHHSRTTPTTTRRIGWHDANQLRRLDARGDRARPDGGRACPMRLHLAPNRTPASTAVTGWMAIHQSPVQSPPPVNPDFAHAELGEKRGEILPEYPAPNITLGCRSHLILLVLSCSYFHFFSTSRYPTSHDDIIRKKYLSTRSLVSKPPRLDSRACQPTPPSIEVRARRIRTRRTGNELLLSKELRFE